MHDTILNYDQYFESLVFLDVGTIYTTASKNKYSIIKRKGGMFISVQLPSRVIVVSMIFWTIWVSNPKWLVYTNRIYQKWILTSTMKIKVKGQELACKIFPEYKKIAIMINYSCNFLFHNGSSCYHKMRWLQYI